MDSFRSSICRRCLFALRTQRFVRADKRISQRQLSGTSQRRAEQREEVEPPPSAFDIDSPPVLVRTGKKHGWGLLGLALIPTIAFGLGTWQIFRLEWKSNLIAQYEDRLLKEPMSLPPRVDPSALHEFDFRRVYATGRFRHDQEMLLGPRMHDGKNGYYVITPLEREGEGTTILINRGWIPKDRGPQSTRKDSLVEGIVTVSGLLREPWKKNFFTPDNHPERGAFYFPDVQQMADHVGSQPVWIEETMINELLTAYDRESRGVPIGRIAEVNLRNNHAQYIFTWYSLSIATSIMFLMLLRKPSSEAARRVRQNKAW